LLYSIIIPYSYIINPFVTTQDYFDLKSNYQQQPRFYHIQPQMFKKPCNLVISRLSLNGVVRKPIVFQATQWPQLYLPTTISSPIVQTKTEED